MACRLFLMFVFVAGVFSGFVAARHNVLFLVVDDLRPQLGCYGESKMVTPNIDQFASKSVKFERAYVQEAVCSPSRTSFLTGRRPDSTHIFDLKHYFRTLTGNYTTLPQHFKNNGYITQSSGKIFHPGMASGGDDDYPYSWSNPAYHAPTQKLSSKKICPSPNGMLTHSAVCPVDLKTVVGGSLPDIQNTDFTIDFLKNRSLDGQPFFMAMGYHRPHLPWAYPKEYMELYPLSEIDLAPNPYYPPWLPEVAWTPWDELREYDDVAALNTSYPFGFVPVDYQYKLRQSYFAAASYMDAQLGRVLEALDQYGLANNTIITLHGDHGWQLGDHGEWCKHTNFDIATHIPMMVHVPGVTAKQAPPGKTFPYIDALDKTLRFTPSLSDGYTSDAFVEAVDLYPTISELAGVDVPPTCPENPFKIAFCTEGVSFVPVIKNLTMGQQNSGFELKTPVINDFTAEETSQKSGFPSSKNSFTWKQAIFSQYPRPGVYPGHNSTNPILELIRIMGYTMRTVEHRYTEWIAYNHTTFYADWNKVYARELYIYSSDPYEDLNVADVAGFQELVSALSQQLRAGWRKALPNGVK